MTKLEQKLQQLKADEARLWDQLNAIEESPEYLAQIERAQSARNEWRAAHQMRSSFAASMPAIEAMQAELKNQ